MILKRLILSRDKTELFLAGVNDIEEAVIEHYGFPNGTLPIRYLGLPLMCRKLKISEYASLVDKVKGKLLNWTVRALSFAGRLQLLSSVISGIVVFWISTFRLPKGCIREIESLCSRFLWSGGIENHHKSKVSWAKVCLPKDEGGLGLRRFSEWNLTLGLKFVWLLFSNSQSLWVAWHKFHHFPDVSSPCSAYWSLKEKTTDTWNWRSILRLRPLAERFLLCSLGNGLAANFWLDSWSPLGPLLKLLGDMGPRNLRIPIKASVADATAGPNWTLPPPRSQQELELHTFLTTIHLPLQQSEDVYGWFVNKVDCNGFSSPNTWEAIRQREDKKDWSNLVWFKGAIPRNSFHMWIANLNRLPTRSRLVEWGLQVSPNCVLCSSFEETRDHLLITCGFSADIWRLVLSRLRLPQILFRNWDNLLVWMRLSTASSPCLLRKIVAQATINAIWKQRNNLLHNLQVIQPSTIFRILYREVLNTIFPRRNRKSFRNLMGLWI